MLKIKEYRRKKGISQSELAKMVNISTGAIGHYEIGAREPNLETITKIAIVLDVNPTDLIDFKKIIDKLGKEQIDKLD